MAAKLTAGLDNCKHTVVNPVFKKLQLKDQDPILVVNAPGSFDGDLAEVECTVVSRPNRGRRYGFALGFAEMAADVGRLAPLLDTHLADDGVLWIAYPKKSSKRYASDISRNHGWQVLGELGYEGVRQVAIDEDWSALRFRKPEYIKNMTRNRSRAMSASGRKRVR